MYRVESIREIKPSQIQVEFNALCNAACVSLLFSVGHWNCLLWVQLHYQSSQKSDTLLPSSSSQTNLEYASPTLLCVIQFNITVPFAPFFSDFPLVPIPTRQTLYYAGLSNPLIFPTLLCASARARAARHVNAPLPISAFTKLKYSNLNKITNKVLDFSSVEVSALYNLMEWY